MIVVENIAEAFELAHTTIGAYALDEMSSKGAGYNIWRSIADPREYICDLGNRIEVNTKDGKSFNVWVGSTPKKVREFEAKVSEQELEIMKLKAKLYDLIYG